MDEVNQTQPLFDIKKIKLIVGLGNTGLEFNRTRHNVAFNFLDSLARGRSFSESTQFYSDILKFEIKNSSILLAKPRTMMNLSGKAVNQIKTFYKLLPEEILVVHDDLDIKLGQYKLHFSKGPKVHNGILSIENRISAINFWRLRIGVDSRDEVTRKHMSGTAYVLGRFKAEEYDILIGVFNEIINNYFT